jgi:hypothetical protein
VLGAGVGFCGMQDPVANLQAYSSCVRLADLIGDGEWRLLVADSRKKLKVRE